MRRAAKIDANQPEIVADLRAAGYAVLLLARLGDGVPDIEVCDPQDGLLTLMEIKAPGGRLTPDQLDWHDRWPGPVYVVRNTAEALAAIEDNRRNIRKLAG